MVDRGVVRPSGPRERGEHARELAEHVVVQRLETVWLEAPQVLVERIDEDPEGEVALELRRGAGEHGVPALVGAARELGEQARLADAWLADQLDQRRPAFVELRQCLVDPAELVGAPYQAFRLLSQ